MNRAGSSTLYCDYSPPAPSSGSSAASTLESRFMLAAWISAIRCLKDVPLISSSTSRYVHVAWSATTTPQALRRSFKSAGLLRRILRDGIEYERLGAYALLAGSEDLRQASSLVASARLCHAGS